MDETSIRHVLSEILSPLPVPGNGHSRGRQAAATKQSKTSQQKSEYFYCRAEIDFPLFLRSNTLGSRLGHQRGDQERHSGVVRERRDEGERGERYPRLNVLTGPLIFSSAD